MLEWKRDEKHKWSALRGGGPWRWIITVQDDGVFFVEGIGGWPSLANAKAWCETQEQAAKHAEPLPAVGSVWGHPDKPDTRRFVVIVRQSGFIFYTNHDRDREVSPADWHTWVRETGAVDLIADRAAWVQRVEVVEHQRDLWQQDSRAKAAEAEFWKKRAEAAEKERDDLRAEVVRLIRERDLYAAALDKVESYRTGCTTADLNAIKQLVREARKGAAS